MTAAALNAEPAPILACTVARDLAAFPLLAEDMEAELGEAWGHLGFSDAFSYLEQPEAQALEVLAIALDRQDEVEATLSQVTSVIARSKRLGVPVLVLAEDIRPAVLHRLMRAGAADFLPYPPPDGAFAEAVTQLKAPPDATTGPAPADLPSGGFPAYWPGPAGAAPRDAGVLPGGTLPSRQEGMVIALHGLAGGVGATTLAVNLAWELANPALPRKEGTAPQKVCLIDLDLQFGSVATYLDLPRREVVYELLADTRQMDAESFGQALVTCGERLHVLTAPADMLPLDFLNPEDVTRLLDMARSRFDFVVLDLPKAILAWTEAVFAGAQAYYVLIELEMRAAQNAQRLLRALQAENLPVEKLRPVLNRAPKLTDLTGRARVKRLAESLGISIDVQLSDAGRAVAAANDQALPLARTLPRIPLRKEIQAMADGLAALQRNRIASTAG